MWCIYKDNMALGKLANKMLFTFLGSSGENQLIRICGCGRREKKSRSVVST